MAQRWGGMAEPQRLLWRVRPAEDGLTALEWLQRRLAIAPTAYLRQLLKKGRLRHTSGEAVNETDLLAVGDELSLSAGERLRPFLPDAKGAGVEILFEDETALVVAKPAGLALHAGVGHEEDHLLRRVETLLKQRHLPYRPFPVHRLDVGTSGPVLFAKGRASAATYGRYFMERQVEKHYLALVTGDFPDQGELSTPVPVEGRLRPSLSRYVRLAAVPGWSLLDLDLQSGRTHQLRRQLADAGHPIAADRRYGGKVCTMLERPFLHAFSLTFPNSDSEGERISVLLPLPDELQEALPDAMRQQLIEENAAFMI